MRCGDRMADIRAHGILAAQPPDVQVKSWVLRSLSRKIVVLTLDASHLTIRLGAALPCPPSQLNTQRWPCSCRTTKARAPIHHKIKKEMEEPAEMPR